MSSDAYKKENYDRMIFQIPKGKKIELQLKAAELGLSVNAMIAQAVEQQYGIDLSRKPKE